MYNRYAGVSKTIRSQPRILPLTLVTTNNVPTLAGVKVLDVASSSLNAANCTAAPDCEVLNRDDCGANGLREDNTCGECKSGTVGVLGPHNSLCVDEATLDPSCSDGREVRCRLKLLSTA